jgi:hypothetical protein
MIKNIKKYHYNKGYLYQNKIKFGYETIMKRDLKICSDMSELGEMLTSGHKY